MRKKRKFKEVVESTDSEPKTESTKKLKAVDFFKQLQLAMDSNDKNQQKELLVPFQDFRAKGNTPLHLVAKHGSSAQIQFVLESGLFNIKYKNTSGYSPAHTAALQGKLENLQIFLKYNPETYTVTSREGFNLLHNFIYFKNPNDQDVSTEGVKYLLETYKNDENFQKFINCQDSTYQNTPLHSAVIAKKQAIIINLLRAGADDTLKNKDNETPAMMASRFDMEKVFEQWENLKKVEKEIEHKKSEEQVYKKSEAEEFLKSFDEDKIVPEQDQPELNKQLALESPRTLLPLEQVIVLQQQTIHSQQATIQSQQMTIQSQQSEIEKLRQQLVQAVQNLGQPQEPAKNLSGGFWSFTK